MRMEVEVDAGLPRALLERRPSDDVVDPHHRVPDRRALDGPVGDVEQLPVTPMTPSRTRVASKYGRAVFASNRYCSAFTRFDS